ncbi:purple acid phosphatase [Zea mays]|uniref:Purple acid phosphatase n=1 Tax=Zea mays TaxID=4577 RepID=C0P5E1_MAIZE|nr:purple acid phosphatase [Zea mays]ACN28207.1 unknown [Zea mays]AQK89019.1 Purple acid phosphatase 10 [Zea mays]
MSNVLRARRRLDLLQVVLFFVAVLLVVVADAGVTSQYRRKLEATVEMPLDADVFRVPPGYNAPQQVHITLGDQEGTAMIVSWVTANELGSSTVMYSEASPDPEKMELRAEGTHTRYDYFNYTSGFIHHCTLTNLKHSTKYYYAMGFGHTVRSFCFTTPPMPGPDVPFKFGLIGDLGQTFDSNTTLSHYEANGGDAVLYVGDLSYADNHPLHDNTRWDTWARFVERSAAHQPWVWTAGNHELDLAPELGEHVPFKPFAHRYPTPFWYSVRVASAHVVVLASYSAYGKYTAQWEWLRAELARVDRAATPWLIVLVHSPWYSSNGYHYMEGETMRVQFERWIVAAKADLVVAGHVHAYERSHRVSNVAYDIINARCTPVRTRDAPVYVTVGDGGNIEGIADNFTQPQPSYSAFREASFGHATLEIRNRTHAYYAWHRNQDGAKVVADGVWLTNRYWMPTDDDIN